MVGGSGFRGSGVGCQTIDYRLWTMDYGLWTMDHGLWTMDYLNRLWTTDYLNNTGTSNLVMVVESNSCFKKLSVG
jgi:hypothetical protein